MVLSLKRTKEEQQEYKDFLESNYREVEQLLKENPGVSDIPKVNEWLADIRLRSVDMVTIYGKLKMEKAVHAANLYARGDELFQTLKNETQKEAYIDATFPYEKWLISYKILVEKYLSQISSEYLTLVSSYIKQNM